MRIFSRSRQFTQKPPQQGTFTDVLRFVVIPAIRRTYRTIKVWTRSLGSKMLPVILMAIAGGALGYGIFSNSPAKIIAFIIGCIICAIVTIRIDLGVVAVMIATASIVYGNAIPKPITVGGQGFGLSELLILFMCVIVFARYFGRTIKSNLSSPMLFPLILFLLAVPISLLVAYLDYRNDPRGPFDFTRAYNNARPIFHYLLFFIVVLGIQTEKQLKQVLRLLTWVAAIVAVLMLVQYILGTHGRSVFIGGEYSGSMAKSLSVDEQDITRSLPPGLALIVLFLLVNLVRASYTGFKKGWKATLSAAVLGMGLVFSFSRSYWVSIFLNLSIVWVLTNGSVKRRLAFLGVVVICATVAVSIMASTLAPGAGGQKFSKALTKRFMSTFERKIISNGTLQDRFRENRSAWKQIKQNPVFGIGVGNPLVHKLWTSPTGEQGFAPYYQMHCSYLELWLVYGLLGLTSFVWLSIVFIVRSLSLFYRARNIKWKILAIAFFAYYIHLLIISATGMTLLHQLSDICTTALVWGITEVAWRFNEQAIKRSSSPSLATTETGPAMMVKPQLKMR